MNQNILLIGLLIGALFFMRRPIGTQRPVQGQWETAINGGATGVPGIPGTAGMYGEG